MKYINKETLRVVGKAGYRIGKEIVREGTKVVVLKAAGAAVGGFIVNKIDGVKNLTLDDVLGDITRKNIKEQKRAVRMFRKQGMSKVDAVEAMRKEMGIIDEDIFSPFTKEVKVKDLEEAKKVFNDLHGSNDEIVK